MVCHISIIALEREDSFSSVSSNASSLCEDERVIPFFKAGLALENFAEVRSSSILVGKRSLFGKRSIVEGEQYLSASVSAKFPQKTTKSKMNRVRSSAPVPVPVPERVATRVAFADEMQIVQILC